MSLSTEILRGAAADAVTSARLDTDLRSSPYVQRFTADPRLVDPVLENAFSTDVARAEEQARVTGYDEGYRAGFEAAQAEVRASLAAAEAKEFERAAAARCDASRAVAALDAAAAQFEAGQVPGGADLEAAIVAAGVHLAEVLLGREVRTGADAIRRVLSVAPAGLPMVLRMHPVDAAAIDVSDWTGRDITICADPTVELGGALADVGAMRIDAQLSAAVARARAALHEQAAA